MNEYYYDDDYYEYSRAEAEYYSYLEQEYDEYCRRLLSGEEILVMI